MDKLKPNGYTTRFDFRISGFSLIFYVKTKPYRPPKSNLQAFEMVKKIKTSLCSMQNLQFKWIAVTTTIAHKGKHFNVK